MRKYVSYSHTTLYARILFHFLRVSYLITYFWLQVESWTEKENKFLSSYLRKFNEKFCLNFHKNITHVMANGNYMVKSAVAK